jgi:carbon-monoxide dehydrogenase medium subunit
MQVSSGIRTIEDIECDFPESLREALAALKDEAGRGRILSGGTDLMVQWASGAVPIPDRALSIFQLRELKGIEENGDALIIGAAVTHAELRNSPLVQKHLPALAAAAATVGGAQIQARGTIGGNVANASPAGDLPPALIITDGVVVVASAAGEREIPLTEFFLDYRKIDLRPDELIVRFVLPKMPKGGREFFWKIGPRAAQAISKVMGACRIVMERKMVKAAAIALGSVAPTVVRLWDFESWLEGQKLDEDIAFEAEQHVAAAVSPIDDIRSTAEYRKWVSGRIVRGFLEQALQKSLTRTQVIPL